MTRGLWERSKERAREIRTIVVEAAVRAVIDAMSRSHDGDRTWTAFILGLTLCDAGWLCERT